MLLAAGASTRLGKPKQLFELEGETLLRRAARTLAESVYFPVVVVLGSQAEAAAEETEGLPVYRIFNEEWRSGMSSSIRAGLARLLAIEPRLDGALITLCDQPRISVEMLNRFAARFAETNAPMIAAAYSNLIGVPALFSSRVFEALSNLDGDKGARQLIRGGEGVSTIDLPAAAFDIDSPADLTSWDRRSE